MSIILITHDLGVVAENFDEVVVMYAGRIAERGPVQRIFEHPQHPYTRGLLSSIPRLDHGHKTRLSVIEGLVPSLHEMPPGCRFQNRCPFAIERCRAEQPAIEMSAPDHAVACHRWREIAATETARA
jgi:oligopeptide/dipeptide ABC transporter ATP-binding protein